MNYIYNSSNYTNVFEKDINEANKSIIISSPSINEEKVYRFIDLIKNRQEAGVNTSIIVNDDNDESLIYDMRRAGIEVIKKDLQECFAIYDDLVWRGGMNLLGKADIFDNLMRIKSAEAASELLMKEYEGKEWGRELYNTHVK